MNVAKWGNSLAIRIPAAIIKALDLKEGDDVEIFIEGDKQFALKRKPLPEETLRRLRRFRGRLPADFKFDRDELHEWRR